MRKKSENKREKNHKKILLDNLKQGVNLILTKRGQFKNGIRGQSNPAQGVSPLWIFQQEKPF